jgi:HTH-type transcriptional regulator, sugar sensing transcriptional regulator
MLEPHTVPSRSSIHCMEAHHHLQALGLTEYEARAYVALLGLGRAQPAKIARHSKIPRPKVYETLERLEARGLATRTQVSPLEYAPLSMREYLARSRREFDGRLEDLERALVRLTPEPAPEAVYPLRGEAAVLGLIEDLIINARRTLHLAGPETMLDTLEARAGRGVHVSRSVLKDQPSIAAEGQTPLLVARDSEAAVVAHLIENAPTEVHGVHTHNPVIVRLVEGYITLAALKSSNPKPRA